MVPVNDKMIARVIQELITLYIWQLHLHSKTTKASEFTKLYHKSNYRAIKYQLSMPKSFSGWYVTLVIL